MDRDDAFSPISPSDSPTPAKSDIGNGVVRAEGATERLLRRAGGWAKRFALIGYVHGALGKLTRKQCVAVYVVSTWISVYKILHDVQVCELGTRGFPERNLRNKKLAHTQSHRIYKMELVKITELIPLETPWLLTHIWAVNDQACAAVTSRWTFGRFSELLFWARRLHYELFRRLDSLRFSPSSKSCMTSLLLLLC